jgi:hypothetical protein
MRFRPDRFTLDDWPKEHRPPVFQYSQVREMEARARALVFGLRFAAFSAALDMEGDAAEALDRAGDQAERVLHEIARHTLEVPFYEAPR